MTGGRNTFPSRQAADLASLFDRVARLENLLRQVPSNFSRGSDINLTAVDQTAHGLTAGQVVQLAPSTGEWSIFNPFVFFDSYIADPAFIAAPIGVVESVINANRFFIRTAGVATWSSDYLDAGNTEAVVPGAKLYAKEIAGGALIGEMTHIAQPGGIVVGFVLSATKFLIAPHRESDATIITLTGTMASAQAELVSFATAGSAATLTDAATIGADDTLNIGLAYKTNGTDVLVVASGTVRTDALTLTWSDGHLWLDPATAGGAVATKPSVPDTEEWRPRRAALQLNNRLTIKPHDGAVAISDHWDIDLSTPPADLDALKWDDTAKKWVPGQFLATQADGPSAIVRQAAGVGEVVALQATTEDTVLMRTSGIMAFMKIDVGQMANRAAYSILANDQASSGSLSEITAADGSVLNRQSDTTFGFTLYPILGTVAGGGGGMKIYYAAGYYFEVNASGILKITWSGNTLTLDPADIVGTGRDFKIREIDICDSTGTAKKIQILACAAY